MKKMSPSLNRRWMFQSAVAVLWVGLLMSPAAAQWETFHADNQRTGIAGPGPANLNEVVWESPAASLLAGSNPIVSASAVYVAAASAVVAFDRADGSILWQAPVPPAAFGAWASPAYDPATDSVYYGSGNRLFRFDTEGGNLVWGATTTTGIVNCSPLIVDDRLYILDSGDFNPSRTVLYSINTANGAIVQSVTAPGWGASAPVYDASNEVILINLQNTVRAYDPDTLDVAWTSPVTTPDDLFGGISLVDGFLYTQTSPFESAGHLFKLDASDGSEEWRATTQQNGNSAPIVYAGLVIGQGGFSEGTAYAFDVATGDLEWEVPQGNYNVSPAGSANGYAYLAGNRDSGLNVVDIATGDVLDTYPGIDCTPAVVDGIVYGITTGGTLIALTEGEEPPLVGDLNNDGVVDVLDLLILTSQWHQTSNETDFGNN